jgi:radical SAM protein with 4Fe4S-binding SPASM domain
MLFIKCTDEDVFMSSYPDLIDIGIMGHCIHGQKGLCIQGGVQCYQSGLKINKPNMPLNDFKVIIDQSKKKVFQVALGGRGDPNKHENFDEILAYCRQNLIVPNYTTSGLDITDREIRLTKQYCGAVAVSWYRQQHTYDAIERFLHVGMKTHIHYVLGQSTIDEAIRRLQKDDFPEGVNAVIFLLHKPVGLGQTKNVLHIEDSRLKEFFQLIDRPHKLKIGFDSCSVPAIVNRNTEICSQSIDTCEGSRWSMYISSDMKALPCSFDQDERWGVDLRHHTIQEAWDSERFEDFRSYLRNSCSSCKDRCLCMGGCPIKQEIVLCDRIERSGVLR